MTQVGVPAELPVPYGAAHVPLELRSLVAQHTPPVSSPPGQKQDCALNSAPVKVSNSVPSGQKSAAPLARSRMVFVHFPFLSQTMVRLVVPTKPGTTMFSSWSSPSSFSQTTTPSMPQVGFR